MAGNLKFFAFALVLCASVAAYGAPALVTEHFDNNTNASWSHLNNTPGDGKSQDYGWSAGDTTGTSVPPNVGTVSAGGEMGGLFTRITEGLSNANYYAFNTGTLDPHTTAFEAHGVYHLVTAGGSTGLLLGFFKDANSFSQFENGVTGDHHNDNPDNFYGIYMVDGNKPQGEIWDAKGFEDRGSQLGATLANGDTVPFDIVYAKPPAGAHEKGTLTVTVGGSSQTFDYTGDFDYNTGSTLLGYFGILGAGHSGGSMTAFIDDVSFTSNNPIPEPASLSLVSMSALALFRRRRS